MRDIIAIVAPYTEVRKRLLVIAVVSCTAVKWFTATATRIICCATLYYCIVLLLLSAVLRVLLLLLSSCYTDYPEQG